MRICYRKIDMIIGFKLADKGLYLKLILKRIDLSKDMLMLDVEDGKEAFLSKDLNVEKLPYSFRYYDFLLNYVSSVLSDDRREYYSNEKLMALHIHQRIFKKSLMQKLIGEKPKIIFQYSAVNERKRKEINHFESPYSFEV